MELEKKPIENGTKALPLFLFGAVAGAALGVLLAPDSGKETRRRLGQWLKERKEKGREAVLDKKLAGV